jgi:uncharacterized protein (DUF1800 family)
MTVVLCAQDDDNGTAPPPIKLTLRPESIMIQVGGTHQFSATVENTTNKGVRYYVNDIAGGNATVGTISATGMYTAPKAVPNPAMVRIKAASMAAPQVIDTSTATVQQGAAVKVTVKPETLTIRGGEKQQFTATVENTTNKAVKWYVNDIAGGNATVGTVSDSGMFTAPAVLPSSAAVRVKANSAVSPQATDFTPVTLQNAKIVITKVTPTQVKPGPFQLTIEGTGLLPTTKIFFDNTEIKATFVSPTKLTAAGTAADSQIGTKMLWGNNPAPGPTTSARIAITVQGSDPPGQLSNKDAHRFLRQATWGPSPRTASQLRSMGINQFLDDQFAKPASTYPDTLLSMSLEYAQERFFRNTLVGEDQLRQRVAWALHQIFVVSGVKVDCAEAFIPYLRILHNNAFGNFQTLMREITLTPGMGEFLDMVNNVKAEPGMSPNENYARELLQLFTVGLVKLNLDGSPQRDTQGNPIPTYGQSVVLDLSRAFTGWTYGDGRAGNPTELRHEGYSGPMEPVARYHDTGTKTLMDGFLIPANQTPEQDLDMALRHIFNHPNVEPFIGKQLIQHLVTSNPSPAYISRVAQVFNNNGQGTRGDLRAVVRAILTDPEAALGTPTAGHLREPVLYITAMLRGLEATTADQPFMANFSTDMAQRVFFAPSVFNYFSPGFRPAGATFTGPEFQIFNGATAVVRASFPARLLRGGFGSDVTFDLTPYSQVAGDANALVNLVDRNIMGEQMPAEMKQAIVEAVNAVTGSRSKARLALYLAFSSLHYQVEH